MADLVPPRTQRDAARSLSARDVADTVTTRDCPKKGKVWRGAVMLLIYKAKFLYCSARRAIVYSGSQRRQYNRLHLVLTRDSVLTFS